MGAPGVESSNKTSKNTLALYTACFSLMVVYLLLGTLLRHGHPIWAAESLVLLGSGVIFALAMAWLAHKVRSLVSNTILVLATLLTLIAQMNLLFEGVGIALVALVLLALVCRQQFPSAVAIVVSALIAGLLFDVKYEASKSEANSESNVAQQRAPVIHIIVDGMTGLEGYTDEPRSQMFKGALAQMLTNYGFESFERAYGRYFFTEDALTNALNFRHGHSALHWASFRLHSARSVDQNAYLSAYAEAGYRVQIYQSDVIDFCRGGIANIDRCFTYPVPNMQTLVHEPDLLTRTKILLGTVLTRSALIKVSLRTAGVPEEWGISLFNPSIIDEMIEDVKSGADGRVFFAHWLLPHSPFVHTPDCRIDYSTSLWSRYAFGYGGHEMGPQRLDRYIDQSECTLLKVEQALSRLQRNGVLDKSWVVIHGDHGSRIPLQPNGQSLSVENLRQVHSTLFAIRQPDGTTGTYQQPAALDELLRMTVARVLGKPATLETDPAIYLNAGEARTVRLEIDPFVSQQALDQHLQSLGLMAIPSQN